ncbi:MAG TPA: hypothetical protein VMS31_16585 [Pyrinomonadaceae bacterium]|nr:hypothetical protein [Pyrinomonadaceae bacterium]
MEQFFPARGFGKLKLGEARKAIRNYRKGTGNLAGTAALLMTHVENGAKFTKDYGTSTSGSTAATVHSTLSCRLLSHSDNLAQTKQTDLSKRGCTTSQ